MDPILWVAGIAAPLVVLVAVVGGKYLNRINAGIGCCAVGLVLAVAASAANK
jgi:hypothetical protein